MEGEYIMEDGGGGGGRAVHFNLPETNGYGMVPGGYQPQDRPHRPSSIEIQAAEGRWGPQAPGGGWGGPPGPRQGGVGGPQVRFAEDQSSRYSQEPIYTPRILREPGDSRNHSGHGQHVQFDLSHQYIPDPGSPAESSPSRSAGGGTPQRRPSQPPPAPPPTAQGEGTPTRNLRANSAGRDNLPPPPPPPANEMSGLSLSGPLVADLSRVLAKQPNSPLHNSDPDCLPPPPPVPDNLAPSPPPPPAPAAAPAPPPPPPPPSENGLFKTNGSLPNASSSPKKISTITSPPQLKKPPPKVKNPEEEVRSDLLKAIRDGIALKKVEAKEAQENGKGQGLSDVATILARRVAVEFSDSDDCPSDSEYDSDDWGETDA